MAPPGSIKAENGAPFGFDGNIGNGHNRIRSTQVGSNYVGMQMRHHPVEYLLLNSSRPEIGRENPNVGYDSVDAARESPFAAETRRRPWDERYLLPETTLTLVASNQAGNRGRVLNFPGHRTNQEGYGSAYGPSYACGEGQSQTGVNQSPAEIFSRLRQGAPVRYVRRGHNQGSKALRFRRVDEDYFAGVEYNAASATPIYDRPVEMGNTSVRAVVSGVEQQGGLERKIKKAA